MRSLDLTPIKEAIAYSLNQAQHLNQSVILSYSWNYADFSQADFSKDISNQVTPASLLAVALEHEYKFYWQQQPLTLAAIGEVVSMDINTDQNFSPQNRFESAQAFCQKHLTHSITKGQTDLGLIPTFAFGGFSFHHHPQNSWSGFPNSMLFIPKWLLQQQNLSLVITFNHCIHPQDHLKELEKSVCGRILEFPKLAPDLQPEVNKQPQANRDQNLEEVTGDRPWTEIVEQAVNLIKHGKLEKVVLARALDIHSSSDPRSVLKSLEKNYPECIAFLIDFGIASFVGATPEILLQFQFDSDRQDLSLKSDAIAGSTRRGLSSSEDQLLGDLLLASLKDRYEHEIVIRSICDRLKEFDVDLQKLSSPKLKCLKNVQHLHTEIEGTLKNTHWLKSFEILRQLHPTAAVGGEPQEIAVQLIQSSEACDRGWYAAPIGWVNSQGEGIFAVGIRSGYLKDEFARIYAGAGIVADSDIASELGETAIKFEALLKALGSFRL